ncbi:MAG TPA: DNA-3-methyladenine glycosylase [Candidatus Saccharimonadales bacterium]|nr:DNA-3-methyladenine glycosylase [Candidatus Saccharimonadales bacterium]
MSDAHQKNIALAATHLAAHDPVLAPVIATHGLFKPVPHTDYYWELVDSIISQQLSIKAARTIEGRFLDLFGGTQPKPEQLLRKTVEELRAVGLSRAKASYVLDLAQHIADGQLQLDRIAELPNDAVIKELVAVKGIGEWTAHMFLIFALGRLDVLPVGDLGIRSGIQKLYGLDHLPTPPEIQDLATRNNWHPYESIACWYVWQALDNAPV